MFVRWTDMPGVASGFYRVAIASGALWIILFMQRGGRLSIPLRLIPLAVLGGVFFAGDLGLYNVAVLHTTAASATFLGSNAPLIVGLLTAIPVPITPLFAVPGGLIGLLGLFRRKRS